MALLAPVLPPARTTPDAESPTTWRDRRRLRRRLGRRLARQDRLSARTAQLRTVEEVLVRAEALVAAGWVQGAWFGYPGPDGPRLSHLPGGRTGSVAASADRFCLVSAVHAATGAALGGVTGRGPGPRLTRAARPVADRAVDTVWRTLAGSDGGPACPPPEVGALRRLDLTRWNDAAGRSADDVRRLLARAAARAREDGAQLRLAVVTGG